MDPFQFLLQQKLAEAAAEEATATLNRSNAVAAQQLQQASYYGRYRLVFQNRYQHQHHHHPGHGGGGWQPIPPPPRFAVTHQQCHPSGRVGGALQAMPLLPRFVSSYQSPPRRRMRFVECPPQAVPSNAVLPGFAVNASGNQEADHFRNNGVNLGQTNDAAGLNNDAAADLMMHGKRKRDETDIDLELRL